MSRIVVDSIDRKSDIARLEINGEFITVSSTIIPSNAKEGDILKLIIDEDSKDKVKSTVTSLEEKLFRNKH